MPRGRPPHEEEDSSSFNPMAPPTFKGENYNIWAIRMKTYLEAMDLWEAVEEDYIIPPLPPTPTAAQLKNFKEMKTRKSKAKACLFGAVSSIILIRIMGLDSAKEIWDFLKKEYEGNERIRGMKVLNLIREFEVMKMKEEESMRDYSDKLLDLVNNIRLLGHEFSDVRIVEKLLVTAPEKYEATITTLENTKDLSKVTLVELLNAFQAQEQRRQLRQDSSIEGALYSKSKGKFEKKKKGKNSKTHEEATTSDSNSNSSKKSFPPCVHCGRLGHAPFKCWKRPEAKCSKCNKMGHEAIICRNPNLQQEEKAKSVENDEEEDLFVATCFNTKEASEEWLVDSGCTNHMTHDKELFRSLYETNTTKVRIGNGDLISVKGKGSISLESCQGTKVIKDVLYVPQLSQNLLSVAQLLEKGYKVIFEDNHCIIKDKSEVDLFRIKKKGKSFSFNPLKEEQSARVATNLEIEERHKRMGHFNSQGMKKASQLCNDIPDFQSELPSCEACQHGKQIRKPFPKVAWRATMKLELVHSDLCGPQRTFSLGGCLYYVVSRDVNFFEDQKWDWDGTTEDQQQNIQPLSSSSQREENWGESSKRGTKSISEIYESCSLALNEPATYEEAKGKEEWMRAMEEEIHMIEKNNTWILINKPVDRKVIGVKWVFRRKYNVDGSINKYKARLVVKGYAQVFGIDYFDTFAPVARLDTIRLLLAISAQKNWRLHQLDVKSAFLNGDINEEIFIEQPEGFIKEGDEDKVLLLKKALYGLKQAPRAWYSKIDDFLTSLGFNKSLSENTLYINLKGKEILIVSLYVDDLLILGSKEDLVHNFKRQMMQAFEMTDLGLMSYFLGIEIKQELGCTSINQQKYAKEILQRFHMEECKSVSTPMNVKEKFLKDDGQPKVEETKYRQLIGCLMYLTATRPDILNAVSILSRFMHGPSEAHFNAAKRILRYIKGTLEFGIKYTQTNCFKLSGYSDSDWGGCKDDMKSTSGYCFSMGSGMISWCSKKQEIVAQSTAEAEFISATLAVNQALWLKKILHDLHVKQESCVNIYVDNQAAISISQNPVFHGKTKHFNIKLYFLRDVQKDGDAKLVYCKTEDQIADIFTKPLPCEKFEYFRSMLGLLST